MERDMIRAYELREHEHHGYDMSDEEHVPLDEERVPLEAYEGHEPLDGCPECGCPFVGGHR